LNRVLHFELETACLKVGGITRYAFKDFDDFSTTARASKAIGIAFPLKSGRFQVSRFSMGGAVAAMDFMLEAMMKARSKVQGTKDQRL
jgi:hypothetical protein